MSKRKSPNHNQKWNYLKIFLFVLSICIAIWVAQSPVARHMVLIGGAIGYIEAFFAGMLYTYTVSAAIGTVLIILLGHALSPLGVALIASFGAVSSDYLIFNTSRFAMTEISRLFPSPFRTRIQELRRNPYVKWAFIVFGFIVIATPLPDELGVGIIGTTNVRSWQFITFSFFLQCVGIMVLIHFVHM